MKTNGPSILICTYRRRSPATNQRLKSKSKWVTLRGSTHSMSIFIAAPPAWCIVSQAIGTTNRWRHVFSLYSMNEETKQKINTIQSPTKQTNDKRGKKPNQTNQEIEEYIEVLFTLQLFSVIMAFDTQDTNTIVTLHSSGGKHLLQILQKGWVLIRGWRPGDKRKNVWSQ